MGANRHHALYALALFDVYNQTYMRNERAAEQT